MLRLSEEAITMESDGRGVREVLLDTRPWYSRAGTSGPRDRFRRPAHLAILLRSWSTGLSPGSVGGRPTHLGNVGQSALGVPWSPGARIVLLLVSLLAALDPAAARAAESGASARLVTINGGRKMYLDCRGSGSPTVVLVAGLKASATDWNTAETQAPTVFSEVAKFTRVCAYDRPGTPVGEKPSRSDPVQQPTTAQDAVLDLHALLRAAKEPAPYVLVGHSYGGLVARLYASTYPDEVSGLVLV